MAISPARLSAYDILLQIGAGEGASSELLAANAESLDERDRALCHELTLGVLRRQIYLDRITDVLSGGKKLDPEVRCALRLGFYQLFYLDRVPAYSAINESVELVKRAKKRSAGGFVNALLRQASRQIPSITFSDELDRISVETSHPRWLIEQWERSFSLEFAELTANANNVQPKVSFRLTARGLTSKDSELAHIIDREAFASDAVNGCLLADRFSPALRQLESKGLIYFQDEASQLVANVTGSYPFDRLLDVCASPGGKISQVAARSGDNLLIAAGDISDRRVAFLKNNCIGQGAEHVAIVRYDAENALPFTARTFDTVLVDAPCSGTGTIRHNPEIRYRISPDDLSRFAKRQLGILSNAVEMVAPGGRLVYSTCSLEPRENEDVVSSFLSSRSHISVVAPPVEDEFITDDRFARTYPFRDNMDGFFIAVLVPGASDT
jgi:16S rRNA (cytosine967-C5)-methyltransferase